MKTGGGIMQSLRIDSCHGNCSTASLHSLWSCPGVAGVVES
jgi:hypothetical protein